MLRKRNASLLKLRHSPDERDKTDAFHDEHRVADDRWSHAKVYSLTRGNSRRLLVTSANFSPAAWGRLTYEGNVAIENFELGVCIEQAAWPFDHLEPFASVDDVASHARTAPSRTTTQVFAPRLQFVAGQGPLHRLRRDRLDHFVGDQLPSEFRTIPVRLPVEIGYAGPHGFAGSAAPILYLVLSIRSPLSAHYF